MPDEPLGEGMDALDALVAQVLASPKYRAVSPDLARRVGAIELAKAANLKEAIKATKNCLHQVAGAYLESPRYGAWLTELRAAFAEGEPAARQALRRVMGRHASTRERLPILDEFYAQTLASLGPFRRVVDLACGLNPLAIPWMPLAEGAEYVACDIYSDLAAFLNSAFALSGPFANVHAHAETRDILSDPPDTANADLVLLLKAIPCLEQVDRDAGARLFAAIRAPRILVSYPLRTLGGRAVGMERHYDERFHALLARLGGSSWHITRHVFASELAYVVER
jgi:16S rRNA (guanine(1405)-N(7))-methyltransferase